ncbi:MAG: hypothetical protein GY795_04125 [Desulfobacterales bacterium]|nr:hypothetical protein [Desulfobacterales bacterium]
MAEIMKVKCNGPGRHMNDVDIDKLLQQQSVLKGATSSGATIPEKLVRPCQICTEGKVIITREMIESLP